MSTEEGTDLLEPMAGPSTVRLPVNILTALLEELDEASIRQSLRALGDDEATETCLRFILTRRTDDIDITRHVIDEGIHRSRHGKTDEEPDGMNDDPSTNSSHDHLALLRKKLETYHTLTGISVGHEDESGLSESVSREKKEKEMDLDDPWAGGDGEHEEPDDPWEQKSVKSEGSIRNSAEATHQSLTPLEPLPVSLSSFLTSPLPESAAIFAASGDIDALRIIYERFRAELWPYRYSILDSLPPWVSPIEIKEIDILPQIDNDHERKPNTSVNALATGEKVDQSALPEEPIKSLHEVKAWYLARIQSLDTLGLLDTQLAWVQIGASLGVPDLDAVGEELSLLSRLVYDAHLSPAQQSEWNLSSWREATSHKILQAYLTNSTTDSIVNDIRGLVMPYLYVLESKAERAGEPHADLVSNYLHETILTLPLTLALPIFEASKATLQRGERIIKDDQLVARLALACLYGSNTRSEWSTMSSIFECLPVWDVSGGDPESDKEATSTTLDSIAAFVRPTRANAHPPTAKDLFIFFAPLPFASLSRALDILDVHLESGEILARWDTPVQLRFLLQSARNKEDQQELAEKMVRRQSTGPRTEQRWSALWADMQKLNGGEDSLLRGAFGVLTLADMARIYLSGVLAAGNFDIARRIVDKVDKEEGLPDDMLESIVLQTSREFYENAESGNIHTGEMKLAYDCLTVAPMSPAIEKERDLIEATSRLTTFSLKSPTGRGKLSPVEIRHAKNRLDLVKRVLEKSDDAYKHPELVLDLTEKLGYRDDLSARVQILCLLSASATRDGDYDSAYDHCQTVYNLTSRKAVETDAVWQALFQLGQQKEFAEIEKRITLLGQALKVCPAREIPQILAVWRGAEEGQMRLAEAAKRRRLTGIRSSNQPKRPLTPSSLTQQLTGEERVLGSRTAARAARLAMGFAGNHLNIRGMTASPILGSSPTLSQGGFSPTTTQSESGRRSNESDRPNFGAIFDGAGVKAGTAEAERVRQQARKALVRGVGWLLGADEREITDGK